MSSCGNRSVLLDLGLQEERNRLTNVVRPLNENDQTKHDSQMKYLIMEANVLFSLVHYLQTIGFIKTDGQSI